jgi:hypothetical protein
VRKLSINKIQLLTFKKEEKVKKLTLILMTSILSFMLTGCMGGAASPKIQAKMKKYNITKDDACRMNKNMWKKGKCNPFYTVKAKDLNAFILKKKAVMKKQEKQAAINKAKRAQEEGERAKAKSLLMNEANKYNSVEEYCITLAYGNAQGGVYVPSNNSCDIDENVPDRDGVDTIIEILKEKGQKPTILQYQHEAKEYKKTLDRLCSDLAISNTSDGVKGRFNKKTLDCNMDYGIYDYNKKWADAAQFKYDTMKPLLVEQHKKILKQRKKKADANKKKSLAEEKAEKKADAEYERKAKIRPGKQYSCTDGYDRWILKYNGSRITFGEVQYIHKWNYQYSQLRSSRIEIDLDRAKGTLSHNGNNLTCTPR